MARVTARHHQLCEDPDDQTEDNPAKYPNMNHLDVLVLRLANPTAAKLASEACWCRTCASGCSLGVTRGTRSTPVTAATLLMGSLWLIMTV
jgi:hypothetical protein